MMLDKLEESLLLLPDLLKQRDKWDSLIVNRRKPYTYRVFTQLPNGLRCCLHKFDACNTEEAFNHPHPWPGAFLVLDGAYQMKVGLSKDRTSKPEDVMTTVMKKFSSYEIINPLTWHSVIPLGTTYTIMVNGAPWAADYAHTEVRTTKGKDLDKMPEDELTAHLARFYVMVKDYLYFKDKSLTSCF